MNSINKEIFDFFSDLKTFDTTENIVRTFNSFKDELLENYWNALADNIEEKIDKNNWTIEKDALSDSNYPSIYLYKQNNSKICYTYSFLKRQKIFRFGLWIDRDNMNSEEIQSVFNLVSTNSKHLIDDQWKMTPNINDNYWPFWYNVRDFDFNDVTKSYRIILPINLKTTVEKYSNEFFESFDGVIQNIISQQ